MSTKQSSKEIVDNIVSYALENNPSVLYIRFQQGKGFLS